MVSCLFARNVYTEEVLARCLTSVGYEALAENLDAVSRHIQQLRWQTRMATGYDPEHVNIPKRFTEIETWKGRLDEGYLTTLKAEYGKRIVEMGKGEAYEGPP
jgi:aldehyde:ferredoxin oxidoreductase